jgi:hypothetical protein
VSTLDVVLLECAVAEPESMHPCIHADSKEIHVAESRISAQAISFDVKVVSVVDSVGGPDDLAKSGPHRCRKVSAELLGNDVDSGQAQQTRRRNKGSLGFFCSALVAE